MTRVLKLGGRVQTDPRLAAHLAAAVNHRHERLCIVHGGGDEVTQLQKRMGITPEFRGGRRVTNAEDIALVQMVLSGSANKRLVAALTAAGVPAVGVSGEDGPTLFAELLDNGSFGRVGNPTHVDPRLIETLLANGYLPLVSPLGRDVATGDALNVNGDDAAAAIAVAIGASELVFVADVSGVMIDGRVIPSLDLGAARALIASGAATGGMIAKLEAAERAIHAGVPQVRIASLDAIEHESAGTTILPSPTLAHA